MFTSQSYGYQAQPFGNQGQLFGNQAQPFTNPGHAYGNIGSSLTPQGFDLGSVVNTVAQGAAQTLPAIIASLLSAHPQIQQLTQQGSLTGGFNLQNQYGGLNAFANRPLSAQFGGQQYGTVSPQGFDFGSIVGTIAQGAAQVLPGLLMSLLSAHPQIQQLARQGTYGGVNPQSLYGGGLNMFENRPQFAWQQGAGVQPQSFDFNNIVTTVAQSAAQVLPGLIASLLSAHPQIQQLARQGHGLGFGQGHIQGQATGYNLNQWGNAGLAPQGFDVGAIAQNIASIISPQIQGIVGGVMSQAFSNQPATMH